VFWDTRELLPQNKALRRAAQSRGRAGRPSLIAAIRSGLWNRTGRVAAIVVEEHLSVGITKFILN